MSAETGSAPARQRQPEGEAAEGRPGSTGATRDVAAAVAVVFRLSRAATAGRAGGAWLHLARLTGAARRHARRRAAGCGLTGSAFAAVRRSGGFTTVGRSRAPRRAAFTGSGHRYARAERAGEAGLALLVAEALHITSRAVASVRRAVDLRGGQAGAGAATGGKATRDAVRAGADAAVDVRFGERALALELARALGGARPLAFARNAATSRGARDRHALSGPAWRRAREALLVACALAARSFDAEIGGALRVERAQRAARLLVDADAGGAELARATSRVIGAATGAARAGASAGADLRDVVRTSAAAHAKGRKPRDAGAAGRVGAALGLGVRVRALLALLAVADAGASRAVRGAGHARAVGRARHRRTQALAARDVAGLTLALASAVATEAVGANATDALVVSRAHAAVAALAAANAGRAHLRKRTIGVDRAVAGAARAVSVTANVAAILLHFGRAGSGPVAEGAQCGDAALALVGAAAGS